MQEGKSKRTLAAAVTGAVVGVGAVIAGAVVLSEKRNQARIKKAFSKARGFVHKYAAKTQAEVKDAKKTIIKVAKTTKKKVRKI